MQETWYPVPRGRRCSHCGPRKTRNVCAGAVRRSPGAERLAAVLGIQPSTVQLYAPLLLPLGLELGGFIFLAAGLAPARRDDEIAVATEAQDIAKPAPVAATEVQENAVPAAEIAKPSRDWHPRLLPRTIATRIPGAGNASCS